MSADQLLLQVLNELRQLRAEVAALSEHLLPARPQSRGVHPLDIKRARNTLHRIAHEFGNEPFTTVALFTAVAQSQLLELAHALDEIGNTKQVGRFFARIADLDIDGFGVTRVSRPGEIPQVWKVETIGNRE
jgi:hypothetical protein